MSVSQLDYALFAARVGPNYCHTYAICVENALASMDAGETTSPATLLFDLLCVYAVQHAPLAVSTVAAASYLSGCAQNCVDRFQRTVPVGTLDRVDSMCIVAVQESPEASDMNAIAASYGARALCNASGMAIVYRLARHDVELSATMQACVEAYARDHVGRERPAIIESFVSRLQVAVLHTESGGFVVLNVHVPTRLEAVACLSSFVAGSMQLLVSLPALEGHVPVFMGDLNLASVADVNRFVPIVTAGCDAHIVPFRCAVAEAGMDQAPFKTRTQYQAQRHKVGVEQRSVKDAIIVPTSCALTVAGFCPVNQVLPMKSHPTDHPTVWAETSNGDVLMTTNQMSTLGTNHCEFLPNPADVEDETAFRLATESMAAVWGSCTFNDLLSAIPETVQGRIPGVIKSFMVEHAFAEMDSVSATLSKMDLSKDKYAGKRFNPIRLATATMP